MIKRLLVVLILFSPLFYTTNANAFVCNTNGAVVIKYMESLPVPVRSQAETTSYQKDTLAILENKLYSKEYTPEAKIRLENTISIINQAHLQILDRGSCASESLEQVFLKLSNGHVLEIQLGIKAAESRLIP